MRRSGVRSNSRENWPKTTGYQLSPAGYFATVRNTPSGEFAPLTVAMIGRSPSGAFAGTRIATWYRPAKPDASAVPKTCALTPLIFTVTGLAVEYVLSAGTCMPGVTAGLVGPNPVPQRMITSPGFAATVLVGAKVPSFTARLKSCRVATVYFPTHRKNAGWTCWAVAVTAGLVPPDVVTVTGMLPSPTSGASTLICSGLMK